MCDPVTIGASLAVGGTLLKGVSDIKQANYAAKVADANAQQQREAAGDAMTAGRQTLRDQYRQASALRGEQVASMSANGIDVGFGSALTVQQDTAQQTQDDATTTQRNIDQNVHGHLVDAANFRSQAAASRASKLGIIAGTVASVGSEVAGGFAKSSAASAASSGFGPTILSNARQLPGFGGVSTLSGYSGGFG